MRRHAIEMRNVYANAIARSLYEGEQPSAQQLDSWVKYDEAANAEDPQRVILEWRGRSR